MLNIQLNNEDAFFLFGFLRDAIAVMRLCPVSTVEDEIKISKIERFYTEALNKYISETPEEEIISTINEFGEK